MVTYSDYFERTQYWSRWHSIFTTLAGHVHWASSGFGRLSLNGATSKAISSNFAADPGEVPAQSVVTGRVVHRANRPVEGAEVDIWHSSPIGLYENQDPG